MLELAQRKSVRFTFFVNPGRALYRPGLVSTLIRGPAEAGARPVKLGTREKLGGLEAARLLMRNEPLLPRYAPVIQRALSEGHEVGLHGGSNHSLWQRDAGHWSAQRLSREITHGMARLHETLGHRPTSFASPGWNAPALLPNCLASLGFTLVADRHGIPGEPSRHPDAPILDVPTWLAGEPGGVGYLEWHRAHRHDDVQITGALETHFASDQQFITLYDHPFFAGVQELPLLEKIIDQAKANDRRVVPMAATLSHDWAVRSARPGAD